MDRLPIQGNATPLALDQFITGPPQRDTVVGHVGDLIGHDIAIGGKEASAVDPNKAMT
jgi:hypothetical protein